MKISDGQVLRHVVAYCEQIDSTVRRFGEDREIFLGDRIYQSAVSMPIFQIGELTKRLSPAFRAATERELHWREIAGMRDRYAHGYLSMDMEVVWNTAVRDIPVLKEQCERLLEKIDSETDGAGA